MTEWDISAGFTLMHALDSTPEIGPYFQRTETFWKIVRGWKKCILDSNRDTLYTDDPHYAVCINKSGNSLLGEKDDSKYFPRGKSSSFALKGDESREILAE